MLLAALVVVTSCQAMAGASGPVEPAGTATSAASPAASTAGSTAGSAAASAAPLPDRSMRSEAVG
jgi:hypothetical protein